MTVVKIKSNSFDEILTNQDLFNITKKGVPFSLSVYFMHIFV